MICFNRLLEKVRFPSTYKHLLEKTQMTIWKYFQSVVKRRLFVESLIHLEVLFVFFGFPLDLISKTLVHILDGR